MQPRPGENSRHRNRERPTCVSDNKNLLTSLQMSYAIDIVVPLGRSYDQYVEMFALTSAHLSGRILGCADGPASFNSVHTRKGGRIGSIDPLYDFSAEQIRVRIEETFPEAMRKVRLIQSEFVWDHIVSVDELAQLRMQAMNSFLDDLNRTVFPGGSKS